jgi:MazG family protein
LSGAADDPGAALRELAAVVGRLRGEGGCPWDRAQTRESLRRYVLEEAYEVVDAIDGGDPARIRDELGDLLFQVVLQSQLASERREFDLAAVARGLAEKIVRRHPHVFGGAQAADAAEVERRWEEQKREERREAGLAPSALAGVPAALPALARAQKVQERAARVGFDWERVEDVLAKLDEERRELAEALAAKDEHALDHELGDLLFTAVNAARRAGRNAEDALRAATARFERRFAFVEEAARRAGRELRDMGLAEMDALWDEAKRAGR